MGLTEYFCEFCSNPKAFEKFNQEPTLVDSFEMH